MKQPIVSLSWPRFASSNKSAGKRLFFLLRINSSFCDFVFFFFCDLFFQFLLLFLSMHNSSLHQRLFQNLRLILNLRIFIVFFAGLPGDHLKRLLCGCAFPQSYWPLFSFPLDCHCVLPDYLPALHLPTALLGEPAILRHSRRSHVWKKSRSQIAWGRGSWFPFQTTVEWIEVFMQTAPYNILSIAQTTSGHQPRFLCSILIRIRNFQRPNFHVGRFGRYIIATFSIVWFSYYDALHFMRLS